MSSPRRIQRKRTAGWRMPENTVYVGRPSKWGNPFKIGQGIIGRDIGVGSDLPINSLLNNEQVLLAYKYWLNNTDQGNMIKQLATEELKGKNLACWCKEGSPCHADVLLELANEKTTETFN